MKMTGRLPTKKQYEFAGRIEKENLAMEYVGDWYALPPLTLDHNSVVPGTLLFVCEIGAWLVTPQGYPLECKEP